MSRQTEAVVRRYFTETLNKGNLDVIDELISRSYVSHYPAGRDLGGGPEDVKQLVASVRRGFPDVVFSLDDIFSDGEKVTARWTFRGVHQGDFMGVSPTGKRVEVFGIAVYRVADGQIQETWVSWDALGLMKQLDVLSTG